MGDVCHWRGRGHGGTAAAGDGDRAREPQVHGTAGPGQHRRATASPRPRPCPLTVGKGPVHRGVRPRSVRPRSCCWSRQRGKGINIYTHGEMLPAHAYPKLQGVPPSEGQFRHRLAEPAEGICRPARADPVHNQLPDAAQARATPTGCSPRRWSPIPACRAHRGGQATSLRSSKKPWSWAAIRTEHPMTGINGGTQVTTGYGHGDDPLRGRPGGRGGADPAPSATSILVGGCDGARAGPQLLHGVRPPDAAGHRRADPGLREIPLQRPGPGRHRRPAAPDGHGPVQRRLRRHSEWPSALAEAFGCGVNDLPLSLVLSWYEQKAVCILLTLLHLGIRNIRLGPTLPAFISPERPQAAGGKIPPDLLRGGGAPPLGPGRLQNREIMPALT